MTPLRRIWQRHVVEVWEDAEAESAAARAAAPPGRLDIEMTVVVVSALLTMIALRYYGLPSRAHWFVDAVDLLGLDGVSNRLDHALFESAQREFNGQVFWAVFRIIVYSAAPLIIGRWVLRRSPARLGWNTTGWRDHLGVYLVLFALMMPLVVAASFDAAFREQYPFYAPPEGESLWPRFWIWEGLYLGQFVALEWFFRGFLVHGLKDRVGAMSVLVMLGPYVAIHLTKPAPEAVGSIVAGLVLGALSLRSGMVLWGALLHFGVAISIDLLVLAHDGRVF
ncbi:MAG: CPBP family intramembrane metalloprotease [Acidimicrobiales bacterium]|nr:CPBP family intramembrane metalloprotease [Acidimicrobiales bacterium]